MRNEFAANRVSHDVPSSSLQVCFALDEQRSKPFFEHVTGLRIPPVGDLREHTIDVLHCLGEVASRCLENNMEVISHQAQCEDPCPVHCRSTFHDADEARPIELVVKDWEFTISPGHNVIHGSWELQAGTA